MAVLAEVVIPTEAVPGGHTLLALPEASIRPGRLVPAERVVHPLFRLSGVDVDAFLGEVADGPGIEDAERRIELDGGLLFRATWTPEAPDMGAIRSLRATILHAVERPASGSSRRSPRTGPGSRRSRSAPSRRASPSSSGESRPSGSGTRGPPG